MKTRYLKSGLASFTLAHTAALLPLAVHGAEFTWDTATGDSIITEGAGSWAVGVGNWRDTLTYDQVWVDGNDAIFGTGSDGTAGIVTLTGDVSVNKMRFETPSAGSYTLDLGGFTLTHTGGGFGNAWQMNATATIENGTIDWSGSHALRGAGTTTVHALITGSGGFAFLNGGRSVFTNDSNSFSGNLYFQNGGVMEVTSIGDKGVPSAAGAGTRLQLFNAGNLEYSGAVTSTTNRDIQFGGASNNRIDVTGAGSLVISGGNMIQSATTNTTLTLTGSTATENVFGPSLVDPGGFIQSLTKDGTNTWAITGTNAHTGPTTVNAGNLVLGDGAGNGSLNPLSAISVSSGATFTIDRNDTVTQGVDFSGAAIAGSGTFAVKGGATVVLNNVATFDDLSSVAVETGSLLNLDFVGTDTIGVLDLGAGPVPNGVYDSSDPSGLITGTGSLTVVAPPASVTWDGSTDQTWTGPSDSTSWSGATYNNGDFATFGDTGAGPVAISGTVAPGTVTVDSASDYTFSGDAIGGATTLTKDGVGRLYLNSANTYTGDTTVNAGQVQINNADALGSTAGGTFLAANTKLELADGITIAEPITNLAAGGSGRIQRISGTNTLTGPITLQGGIDLRGGHCIFQGGFTSANNSSVGLNGANYVIDTTPVTIGSGTFGLTSAGNSSANTSHLNVSGSTWGLMRINFGGYLTLGLANAMPAAAGVEFGWNLESQSSGTLDLNGFDQTVGFLRQTSAFPGVNGDQQITGGGTLTIDTAAGTYDYHGRITDGATPTSIVKNGVGTQILNNQSGTPSNYTGSLTINDGILESVSGSDFPDASSIIVTAGTLNLNYVGTDTIAVLDLGSGPVADGVYDSTHPSGLITGTGSLTVVAPPEPPLVWDGSTDTDWTNPDSTSWSGSTYEDGDDVSFLTAGAGPVNVSATVSPNSMLVDSASDYSFSGSDVSGATGLTKSGVGVLTLASANTYTGVTTVSEGRLTVTNGAALGTTAGNTVVASDASLSVEGNITVAEALDLTGSGGGTGVLASNGNNTVSGAITLTGGRIETVDGTGKLIVSGGITGTGTILVGDIQVDAPIDFGAGGIQFAGSGINYAGPGFDIGNVIDLNSTGNNWTSTLLFFDANLRLGVNNAIPTGSTMTFGFIAIDFSTVQLDLNGFDQTVASIETQTLGVGGDINITGGGTLTVNQATDTEYQGRITDGGSPTSLVKSGTGILTINNLSGTPSNYTGATTVSGGTLSLSSADLDDSSTVSIATGAVLNLTHAAIDDVGVLEFNGVPQADGTYNAGNSGGFITGTGSIRVGGATGYSDWASTHAPIGTSLDDFDADGVANGVEYVLGGTKDTNDLDKLPGLQTTGGNLVFEFDRAQLSIDGTTTVAIEVGTTLASWPDSYTVGADTAGSDPGVTVTKDTSAGFDTVTLTITQAPDPKKFARLSVTIGDEP